MARVTVEDCTKKVPNHFELVILAAFRARQLCAGANPEVSKGDDKNPVIALREIAEDKLSLDKLREGATKGLTSSLNQFESDEELVQILAEEQEKNFEESLKAGNENFTSFTEEIDLDETADELDIEELEEPEEI